MTNGLKNPANEFEKICKDFNIKCYNNCNYIDYNEAKEKKLSTFVLWGSKDGLELFFKENNFDKQFKKFMSDTENRNKAGIYLCININRNIGYLIIWPGKFSYKYNRIDEPSDNMLLTLVRYGFSLSPNSIICLSLDEIKNFDFKGYKIFKKNETSVYASQRNKIYINENQEKIFKIDSPKTLDENLKEKLKNKKIKEIKINLNCLLFYEEIEDKVNIVERKENLNNFINHNAQILLKFNDKFDASAKEFYLLIKNIPFYQQNNKDDEIYIEEKLKDFISEKINNDINELFKEFNDIILNQKYFEQRYKCQCGVKKNHPLFYNKNQKEKKIFYHKSCYEGKDFSNLEKLDKDKKDFDKYELYKYCKEGIKDKLNKVNKYKTIKNDIVQFFNDCENTFESISKLDNLKLWKSEIPKKINREVILEEIRKLKIKLIDDIFEDKKISVLNKNNIDNLQKKWVKKWKEKFNKYFDENKEKRNKYIILKDWEKTEKHKNKKKLEYDFIINYEYYEIIEKHTLVNLYEMIPFQGSQNLCLSDSEELGQKYIIENYYPQENRGLIIYKYQDKFKLDTNDINYEDLIDLYDYDIISKTLILYRKEENIKKIGVYVNENKIQKKIRNLKYKTNIEINHLGISILNKILLK